jgi:hypothetical protein
MKPAQTLLQYVSPIEQSLLQVGLAGLKGGIFAISGDSG